MGRKLEVSLGRLGGRGGDWGKKNGLISKNCGSKASPLSRPGILIMEAELAIAFGEGE